MKTKILLIISAIFLLIVSFISFSATPFNPSQAWHSLQQITTDETGTISVDANSNGIIDNAEDANTVQGHPISELLGYWSPTAPTTGIFYDGGNVGIGTSNPLSRLHITRIGSDNIDVTNSLLYIRPSTQGYGLAMGVKQSYPPTLWMQGMVNDNPGAANIILNPLQGNVGIGTTSPSVKLEVNGYIKGTGLCIGNDCKTSWSQVGGSGSTGIINGWPDIIQCTQLDDGRNRYLRVVEEFPDEVWYNDGYDAFVEYKKSTRMNDRDTLGGHPSTCGGKTVDQVPGWYASGSTSGSTGSLSCTYRSLTSTYNTGNKICGAYAEECLQVDAPSQTTWSSGATCTVTTGAGLSSQYQAKCCKIV